MVSRLLLQYRLCLLKCEIYKKIQVHEELCKRRRKRIWTRKWILRRDKLGMSNTLMRELALEEPLDYRNIIRMTETQFDELLLLVTPLIQRQDTTLRPAIPAKLKLEITLRFLAGGESFKFLAASFRVPVTSISLFLPEVLSSITEVLSSHLKIPTKAAEWKLLAQRFHTLWNFPRCCGAIDGKHVIIKRPPKSGAEFYNYKGTYSIVLLALVDADYCFTYINVGANGRAGDAGIFRDSSLGIALESNLLGIPPDHIILGDDAFPLKSYLMKPYPYESRGLKEKVFNYRLSRARNKVENAFGILASRFRIFLRPIEVKPSTVDKIIWAACTLHNWLRRTSGRNYLPPSAVDVENLDSGEIIPGLWRSITNGLTSVSNVGSNNYKKDAEAMRRKYSTYFIGEGAVPWQWKRVGLEEEPSTDELAKLLEEEEVDND